MMNRMMNMMANDMVAAIAAENMELFNRLGMTRAFKKSFETYLDLTGIEVKDGDEWRRTAEYAIEDGNIVVEYDRNDNIVNVYKDDCDGEELIDDSFFTLKPGRSAGRKKNRQDALHRIKDAGGKKRGRTRKDYVEHRKDSNHEGKLYQQSIYMGGGTVKNRRYAEKMADLERGVVDDQLAEQDALDYFRLVESRDYFEGLVERLAKECDALDEIERKMRDELDETYLGTFFQYLPTVYVESFAFDALENAEDSLNNIKAQLERYF